MDPSADPRFAAFEAAFDAGRFFDAHEHLEDLWQEYDAEDRDAVRGLVQVAVALTHRQRGNAAGARRVGERAVRNLEPWFPVRFGLDLARLARDLCAALDDPAVEPRIADCRAEPARGRSR